MPGTVLRTTGELVYEAVDANLNSGVLVIPSTTATSDPTLQGVKVATDAAKNVLGFSSHNAVTAANLAALESGTDAFGNNFINASIASSKVTVYERGVGKLTYTAAAVAYGAKLCAAANGAVRAWLTADGADAMVGWCCQPGGVSSAGGVFLAFIDI